MPWPAPKRPIESLPHHPGRRPRRGSWKTSGRPPFMWVGDGAIILAPHGGTRAALPSGAEKAPWRLGDLPEGQLGAPRPAREPRAGGGGRRGGRRRSPVAPIGVERG